MAPPNQALSGNGEMTPARRRARKARRRAAGITANRPGAATGGTMAHPTLATQEARRTYHLGIKHVCDVLNVPIPAMFAQRT